MTNSTEFSIRTEKHAAVGIKSANQVFGFIYWRFEDPRMNWDAHDQIEFLVFPFAEQPGMKDWPSGDFRWRIGDFGWQDISTGPNNRWVHFVVPHWSIVIPLTLISLWLLLTKPRRPAPKKIPESTSNEGT